MENDIILVIDTSTRDLSMYTCAATQLQDGRIVLRKGADIQPIHKIDEWTTGYAILVLGSYQAQSSAGFTEVYAWNLNWREVAGGIGFTWENSTGIHGKALRRFRKGVHGVLIPNGGKISRLNTNDQNSNTRTAEAAMLGLQMGGIGEDNVLIIEGQSDYVKAWSITHIPSKTEQIKFPPEHREDIFEEEGEVVHIIEPSEPNTVATPTDPNTRIKDEINEHKHPDRDYWHPVSRVHTEYIFNVGNGSIVYHPPHQKLYLCGDHDGNGTQKEILFNELIIWAENYVEDIEDLSQIEGFYMSKQGDTLTITTSDFGCERMSINLGADALDWRDLEVAISTISKIADAVNSEHEKTYIHSTKPSDPDPEQTVWVGDSDDVYDLLDAMSGIQFDYVDLHGNAVQIDGSGIEIHRHLMRHTYFTKRWLWGAGLIQGISTSIEGDGLRIEKRIFESGYGSVGITEYNRHTGLCKGDFEKGSMIHKAKLLLESKELDKLHNPPAHTDGGSTLFTWSDEPCQRKITLLQALHVVLVWQGGSYFDLIRFPNGGHIPPEILHEEYGVSWETIASISLGKPRDRETFACPICGRRSFYAGVCRCCDDPCDCCSSECSAWITDITDIARKVERAESSRATRKEFEHGAILRMIKSGNWKGCRYVRGGN